MNSSILPSSFEKLLQKFLNFSLRRKMLHLGKDVLISPSAKFENLDKIFIDNYCQIFNGAVIIGKSFSNYGIKLGERTTIREYAQLNAYSGYIHTGKNVFIGQGTMISGHGGVEIGDNTLIANLCSITSSNHIYCDTSIPLRFQGETSIGIKIGSNVWIASQVSILDGVSIGDNAVVSSGSVVARDIPEWSVAGGVPARIIKDRRN